jgi:hypothetical protein
MLEAAALTSAVIERQESVTDVAGIVETLGDRVVSLSGTEVAKFKKATESLYAKYENAFSTDLIKQIQAK